jgi:soluble lytic murein transglycosylase-like protein
MRSRQEFAGAAAGVPKISDAMRWLVGPLGGALLLGGCARERGYYIATLPPADMAWLSSELPQRIPPMVDPRSAPYNVPRASSAMPAWAGEDAAPFAPMVQAAATYYQLPPELIWSVIKVESNFRVDAESPAGARGLMQLMPSTARELGVRDLFDPQDNIYGGARYLRLLANRFRGDLNLSLAGYNAGPYAVVRAGGIPPYPETVGFVQKVLGFYYNAGPSARTAAQAPLPGAAVPR